MKRKNILYFAGLLALSIGLTQSFSTKPVQGASFTVTTTADNGNNGTPTAGSLRAAIISANNSGGADTIIFSIVPLIGVKTITPPTPLPTITGAVTIDGWSQSGVAGYTGPPLIELNGTSAGAGADGLSFSTTSGSTVKGMVINRFTGNGISLLAGANNTTIQGCYIGTHVSGNSALANSQYGISIVSANNTIGGLTPGVRNIISGNSNSGIRINTSTATGNVVSGNYIGTNVTGTGAIGNNRGIDVENGAHDNTIGGTGASSSGNLLSGNGSGILLSSSNGNLIQGNFIGTDVTGTLDIGNTSDGIVANNSSTNNTVGGAAAGAGNVISGNNNYGVYLSSPANTVLGNIIGTDVSGTMTLGNSHAGVNLTSSNNIVGGTTAAARNIISGNERGVLISGDISGNVVSGNYIGTNKSGTATIGNLIEGVYVTSGGDANTIGGITPSSGNLISGNGVGISVFGSNCVGNFVQGNFIGTDVSGTLDLGNLGSGVWLQGAVNTLIGGTTPAARNVISGNNADGVLISNAFATGNVVSGNLIGTKNGGSAPLGNTASGVAISDSAHDNEIGGTLASLGNVISSNAIGVTISASATGNLVRNNLIGTDVTGTSPLGNSADGVLVFQAPNNTIGGGAGLGNLIAFNGAGGVACTGSSGTAIFANSIQSNVLLGIDLDNNGVTANDPLDSDTGANNRQNYPVIGTAANTGTGTFLVGSLNSAPNQTFTIEFFSNTALDPSAYGEGRTFLGAINATTGLDGNVIFNVTLPLTVPAGQYITSTATDASRNTSEFSSCKQVTTSSPTSAEFASANATGFDDGVLIQWQTGMEVDNVGFNLYRDEYGNRSLVNQQLIAGSAFRVGEGVAVKSGLSYQWWDAQPASKAARYWIESLDLNGNSAWYGPFAAPSSQGKEHPAHVTQAKTLASLGGNDSASLQLEPHARAYAASKSSKSVSPVSSLIAPSDGVKIAVKQAGYYRVTQPELLAAGLDPACDPRDLQLFVDGREQAISVVGESDGRFDPKDAVEFYGLGIDSTFTASHNYFLVSAKEPGRRIATLGTSAKPNPGGSFAYTTERRNRTVYFSALLNGDRENFFGAVLASQPLNQALAIQHADLTASATLEVALQGVTNFPHFVTVQLNGTTIGYANFTKVDHSVTSFQVDPSLLQEGNNTVTLKTTGNPGDMSLVDYLRLTYQHKLVADNDSLRFTATGQQQLTIEGFTDKSVRVFDVTNPDAVQEIAGAVDETSDGFTVSIQAPGDGPRTLLAVTDSTTRKPSRIWLNSPSDLRSPANAAQFVIVAHQDVMNKAEALKALRQAQGLSAMVVDIEDVYDEFSFGQKTPYAVKDFLSLARKAWRVPVRYVLLFGDASYDTKNYLGLGEFDQVPTRLVDTTFLEAASDDWLADFNNDGVADLAIGRLPVRNDPEAGLMIKKLIGYDKATPSTEVLGVADRNEGYDFEHAIDQLRDLVPGDLKNVQVKRGQLGDAPAKAALLDAINRGQKIVSYSGHGSANVWRGNLLTSADAGLLQNANNLAMFLMMNCLNGYFTDPSMDSLSEALLKAPQGGAVAAWASSAMTFPDSQSAMSQELYRQVFSNRGIRIGDAIVRAKAAAFDVDVRQSWILFADPTMRLR